MAFRLLCRWCGKEYPLDIRCWSCPSCKRPLNLVTEYPRCNHFAELVERGEVGLWRYKRLIPFSERHTTLGERCTPIYEAIHGSIHGLKRSSLADGLRIEDPPRKDEILNVIRAAHGDALTVNDDEIVEALMQLYKMGIIVEPTSATAYAAFKKLEGLKNVLIPMTGTGIKTVDKISSIFT